MIYRLTLTIHVEAGTPLEAEKAVVSALTKERAVITVTPKGTEVI